MTREPDAPGEHPAEGEHGVDVLLRALFAGPPDPSGRDGPSARSAASSSSAPSGSSAVSTRSGAPGLDEPPPEPQTDRILDAALELFSTFGLRRTTMDDVARASGLGRATIYRRFPGKNDLVTGVLLREARRFFGELDRSVAAYTTLEDRLVEGFVTTLRISREQRLVNRLLVLEPELLLPHATERAGPLLAAARGYLARRLRAAQQQGRAGDFDPEVVAEILVRLTHSLLLTPNGHIPLDDEGARAFARRYLTPMVT